MFVAQRLESLKTLFAEEESMKEMMTRLYVKVRGFRKGQTMTEYALILAAVAIVVFVTYEVMGQDIGSLVNKIDSSLGAS